MSSEMPSQQVSSLRARSRVIIKAERQGVVKENFVVDFGDLKVSAAELAELARYNVTQRDSHVSRLWVMVGGQLTELTLST